MEDRGFVRNEEVHLKKEDGTRIFCSVSAVAVKGEDGSIESFHDVYYRTDRDGLITIISPSVKTQAGYDPSDVIGLPVTDFYPDPDERETFNQNLKQYGYVNDYELQLLARLPKQTA